MPSMLLITAADYAHHLTTSEFFGVEASGRVDGRKVMGFIIVSDWPLL